MLFLDFNMWHKTQNMVTRNNKVRLTWVSQNGTCIYITSNLYIRSSPAFNTCWSCIPSTSSNLFQVQSVLFIKFIKNFLPLQYCHYSAETFRLDEIYSVTKYLQSVEIQWCFASNYEDNKHEKQNADELFCIFLRYTEWLIGVYLNCILTYFSDDII